MLVRMIQYNHMKGRGSMEGILKQILDGQNKLIQQMDNLEKEVVKINTRLDDMPTKADLEKAIGEQQKDVIAMLERTATKDSMSRLDTKIDLLNNKLFQTETDLAMLKLVK